MTRFLPTSRKEAALRGWEELDVVLFSGDAYVDHPAFGAAVIGRTLEAMGLKVAIVPQPNWRDDLRDFKKLGKPRLFFAVSAGAMDSMVNKYTANKRLRSEDAYTPDARADMRPDYPTLVYSGILKDLYPDVPVVVGGIEASLRRLSHYDYWQDRLLPSILVPSRADVLVYGAGEKPLAAIVSAFRNGAEAGSLTDIPQTVVLRKEVKPAAGDLPLFSYEDCLKDKRKQAQNFRRIEEESNKLTAGRLIQQTGDRLVVVNPPYPPASTEELDAAYDLPYTRTPHP
ncbi:MAG: YgiQ family radical SAM protein, partial [Dysgonamonadaceae bacterium]|nr:YgiQ family radical SAM protein [Dysgonamonadaceae bacterium]